MPMCFVNWVTEPEGFTSLVVAEHAEAELDSSAQVPERLLSLEPGAPVRLLPPLLRRQGAGGEDIR